MPRQLLFVSAISILALFQSIPTHAAHDWVIRYTNSVRLMAIAAGNGKLVAVGDAHDNKIIWSENGVDWQAAAHSGKPYALAFGGGKFVAGGGPGESLMISENGKDWTVTHSSETDNYIWDIVWFNGAYVALARTSLLRSVDGLTWERLPTPGIFYSMGLLNGELVLQGPDQGMQTSADLVNWRRLRQPERPAGLFSANNLLFYGAIMSRDGLEWKFLMHEGQKLFINDAIDAGGRTFLVSGSEIFDVTSRDPSGITKIDAPPVPLNKIVYWDGRLFAACHDGSIRELSSLTFLRTSSAGGRIQLDASGLAGQRVRIDSSTDMVNWLEGATVLTLPATWELPDSSAAQRFYRSRILD